MGLLWRVDWNGDGPETTEETLPQHSYDPAGALLGLYHWEYKDGVKC